MTLKTRSARAKQAIQDQAMAELQDLIAEVDQLMSGTGSLAGKEGANLREQINSVLHRGRDAIERTRRGVVQRSQAAAEATEEYVEDHPWQTIAVSAAPASYSACWWAAARAFPQATESPRSAGFSARQGPWLRRRSPPPAANSVPRFPSRLPPRHGW